jgi:E3 ubiquitin-protein ligase ATL10/75/76/77/78
MQSISCLPSSIHDRRLFKDRKILQSSTLISPSMAIAEGSTAVNYVAKASFDSGIAIILAALLCSVLCALSVSAVVRCRLRCRRRRVESEPGMDLGVEGVKGSTCREIDIKALPATVYHTAGSPVAGMDCPICLTEFAEGEKVRVLPECSHTFHVDCIDAWVVSNPSCPSCRHSLLYVVGEKSSGVVQPAAEPTQGAQMHGNESSESVRENHVVQSSNSSVDDTTMAASSSLDCIRSNDLEGGNVGEV